MTYGKIVAKRFKRQYYKKKEWATFTFWDIQPEDHYTILLELRTKKAIEALIGSSWTKNLPRKVSK